MKYINKKINDIIKFGSENKDKYKNANPFPHIVIDDFFDEEVLNKILEDFPTNIANIGDKFNNKAELKLSLNDTKKFSSNTNNFINFLNSNLFLEFLQIITNIDETLITDPYLQGGGLHELKNEGFLNVHSDFNKHPKMKLDRRLNILIYLNKNWKENNGGQLELWDKDMKKCSQSIIPKFNRMVIFSTTSFSYHGNPNKVTCDENKSRKSIALYYYTNGRPFEEMELGNHSTVFRKRPGSNDVEGKVFFKKIFGKFYIRKKGKITN